mmetsp:Transcript_49031/g.113325  ORF Transcript_49031/g.113325 Transcript_49031/m.113325 type:complete len:220 (+) Transcript_49031:465-1124(+)
MVDGEARERSTHHDNEVACCNRVESRAALPRGVGRPERAVEEDGAGLERVAALAGFAFPRGVAVCRQHVSQHRKRDRRRRRRARPQVRRSALALGSVSVDILDVRLHKRDVPLVQGLACAHADGLVVRLRHERRHEAMRVVQLCLVAHHLVVEAVDVLRREHCQLAVLMQDLWEHVPNRELPLLLAQPNDQPTPHLVVRQWIVLKQLECERAANVSLEL